MSGPKPVVLLRLLGPEPLGAADGEEGSEGPGRDGLLGLLQGQQPLLVTVTYPALSGPRTWPAGGWAPRSQPRGSPGPSPLSKFLKGN